MSFRPSGASESRVPIVDLFAGPGGLGEGFSALDGGSMFRIAISIEMEKTAHETLRLRSFFRQFGNDCVPPEYYEYVRGALTITELMAAYRCEWEQAEAEAWLAELGVEEHARVRERVDRALGAEQNMGDTVLVGGPPCQAYSLAGRSRMRPVLGADFESDSRHFLYREYLKLLADHAPSAFVLENVKGMLSSTSDGKQIFDRIQTDLRYPGKALDDFHPRNSDVEYELFPLGSALPQTNSGSDPPAESFVLRAEELGLPQARHRVIIVGIRSDRAERARAVLMPFTKLTECASLDDVLAGLPPLRSGLSRTTDSDHAWEDAVQASADRLLKNTKAALPRPMRQELAHVRAELKTPLNGRGGRFVSTTQVSPRYEPSWFVDSKIGGVLNHESRGHMRDDLTRYLFAAVFGRVEGRSPTLGDFPDVLLPQHQNVRTALTGSLFSDRFRVQLHNRPSTTITSHISKDGHYYIHPDPRQCRSLTVREAARLQTFPDNYFFEGPRTKQYVQVGNAVPPLLARRIAGVLAEALGLVPREPT